MQHIIPGEEKAWDLLCAADPCEISRNAGAVILGEGRGYCLKAFGREFDIETGERRIISREKEGELFLGRLGYFFRLSALWYLLKAKDIGTTGRLVEPSGMAGGDIFFRGTHVLPLESVAKKYTCDKEGFLSQGLAMGGRQVSYGDAAVELNPFPRMPVTLILWLEDEEWPARAKLLFDSTATVQLPMDIVWSIAMMSALIFL